MDKWLIAMWKIRISLCIVDMLGWWQQLHHNAFWKILSDNHQHAETVLVHSLFSILWSWLTLTDHWKFNSVIIGDWGIRFRSQQHGEKTIKCGCWPCPSQLSHYIWIEKQYSFVLIWFTWSPARRLLAAQESYPSTSYCFIFLPLYQWGSVLSSVLLLLLNTLIAASAIRCDSLPQILAW